MHRLLQHVTASAQASPKRFSVRLIAFAVMRLAYVTKAFSKIDIRHLTHFSGGVFLSDKKLLVIGAKSIGAGTIIHHLVTIGVDIVTKQIPEIGSNVWIGPDCVIYGGVRIGDGATVLPGSVVSVSVPDNAVVQGIPCKIISNSFDNRQLRSSLDYRSISVRAD